MPKLILAAVNPDNTPHGYNLTFAFPMLLFIIIGGILYILLFSRPHRRVPARSLTLPARSSAAPSAKAAPSAAVAGGQSAATGGGAGETHGAHLVASTDDAAAATPAATEPAADEESAEDGE